MPWPIIIIFLTTYFGVLSLSMISHLFSPHTIIPAPEENPSRVMTWKCFVLSGICGCWQTRPFTNKSFLNQTGRTRCLMPRLHTRELALTHHTFKAGWHTSAWEWHFWTYLCLNRLIPLSLCALIWAFRQLFSFIKRGWLNATETQTSKQG